MLKTVNKEKPFSVNAESFAVQSTSAFTLAYSVNRKNWKEADEETPANEPLIVKNSVRGLWYKLVGNTDTATLIKY